MWSPAVVALHHPVETRYKQPNTPPSAEEKSSLQRSGRFFLDRGKGKGGGSCDAEDVSAPMHPQPMHPRATTHTHTHPRTCARANFLGFCTNPAWPLPPGARV